MTMNFGLYCPFISAHIRHKTAETKQIINKGPFLSGMRKTTKAKPYFTVETESFQMATSSSNIL